MNKNDTKIKKMVKIVLFSVKQENFSQIKGPMGVCSGLKELSETKD